MSDSGLTRRRVLAATVSLSAVSLAGCLGNGDTFEWEADDTGVQHYYCTPHAAFMYGSVEVV